MYFSHIKTIEHLIYTYRHEQPLHIFLKAFFRANKKSGARDRKIITSYIYNYYRLTPVLKNLSFDEMLPVLTALDQLQSNNADEIAATVKTSYAGFDLRNVFLFPGELSDAINREQFQKSMLVRPRVFIRIKKGYENVVMKELDDCDFSYEAINVSSLAFKNESHLTATKSFKNGLFEIQDLSSQQTGNYFDAYNGERWWDCCAGSGGKSLLFKDKFPGVHLTISDVRASMLQNAAERFSKSGMKGYKLKIIDMMDVKIENSGTKILFEGIIIDAPCSGSGTWARTPEDKFFFSNERIDEYQSKQITITTHASKFLKQGGQLIYITCSAFKKENEKVTQHLLQTTSLQLIKSQLFRGYEQGADTMYLAQFRLQ